MNLPSFIQSTLSRDDDLFATIYRFNELVSLYIDKSHLSPFPQLEENWEKLKESTRVQKKISHMLLRHLNLESRLHYDFVEPRLRLALLDAKVLNELLIRAGAVYYSEKIGKIIVKKDVLALKESIGEQMYFFATKKASLIKGLAPEIELPEVSQFGQDEFFQAGQRCLEICFSQVDSALIDRLILKFPSDAKWNFQTEVSEEQKAKAWKYLHRIVTKEINPELEKCFT